MGLDIEGVKLVRAFVAAAFGCLGLALIMLMDEPRDSKKHGKVTVTFEAICMICNKTFRAPTPKALNDEMNEHGKTCTYKGGQ